MCGPSDLVRPDLKKIIDDMKRNKSNIFDSKLSFLTLLKIKFIKKTPEKTINNKAFVCLVDPSVKGFGYSKPIK